MSCIRSHNSHGAAAPTSACAPTPPNVIQALIAFAVPATQARSSAARAVASAASVLGIGFHAQAPRRPLRSDRYTYLPAIPAGFP